MIEKIQNDKCVYSDGVAIEEEILNIAKAYSEEEIPAAIANDARYLINNTFSPVRRNLLEWYPFRKNCTILEVGAGMGSLTGLLCDKAKYVTSVEMSEARASVIRERYKTRTNLTICCENILSLETDPKYDYVVMIGVLEYAAIFSDSDTPFSDFLAKLKSFLKPDGVLLFAIENQFGLKYWIGGAEDHLQKPFVGIQGYREPKTAKTFSKAELEAMCSRVGFDTRFYYLLPDYKFPTAIFTDNCLPTYHDVQFLRYAYSANSCLTAKEEDLYRDIIQNGVFPFFANSYLIEASAVLPEGQIVRVSARSEVVPEKRIITYIDNEGFVYKLPQIKIAKTHIEDTYRNEQRLAERGIPIIKSEYDGQRLKTPFCHDRMANEVFSEALENGDIQTVKSMIDALEAALRASSEVCDSVCCNNALTALGGAQDEDILVHGYMDMTFYNAFWSNGELVFFDQEWDFPGLPVRFILYYGLKNCFSQTMSKPQIPFSLICEYIGVSKEKVHQYDALEGKLWNNGFIRNGDIYGADNCYNQYNVCTFDQLCDEKNRLENALNIAESECNKLGVIIQEQRDFLAHRTEEVRFRDEEIQKREEIIQDQKAFLAHRTEEVRFRDEEIQRQGEELRSTQQHESILLAELDAIKNSRSWRLARGIAKLIRIFLP